MQLSRDGRLRNVLYDVKTKRICVVVNRCGLSTLKWLCSSLLSLLTQKKNVFFFFGGGWLLVGSQNSTRYGGAAANVTASWGEFKSPEGHTYYYNSITKESSWTQPAGYQPHAAVGAAAAAGSAASASGASTAAVVDSNGASRTSGGQQLTYDQLLDQERIRKAGSQGDAGAAEDELPGPPEKKAKKDDADGFFKQDEKTNCFMYIQGLPTEVSKC